MLQSKILNKNIQIVNGCEYFSGQRPPSQNNSNGYLAEPPITRGEIKKYKSTRNKGVEPK